MMSTARTFPHGCSLAGNESPRTSGNARPGWERKPWDDVWERINKVKILLLQDKHVWQKKFSLSDVAIPDSG